MNHVTLIMCSITYAQRAEELLCSAGYHVILKKNPDCDRGGYLVTITGEDIDAALKLLRDRSVKICGVLDE
ncbi:MAG: hypothetical protein KH009_03860 [Clostridiales bacterium]|nr:hypothetical protein [Clostridiales bacterium]